MTGSQQIAKLIYDASDDGGTIQVGDARLIAQRVYGLARPELATTTTTTTLARELGCLAEYAALIGEDPADLDD